MACLQVAHVSPDSDTPAPSPSQPSQPKNQSQEVMPTCGACGSSKVWVDWAAGDRVCRECGVVQEEHVREEGAEWKDFGEAEDLVKNAPSAARSGMVPIDETRYHGGLQPTTLSRQAFGGAFGNSACESSSNNSHREASIRRRLLRTNQHLDQLMDRRHKSFLQDAKVARDILSRRRQERLLQNQRRKRQRHDANSNSNSNSTQSNHDENHENHHVHSHINNHSETESVTTAATATEIDIPEAKPRGVLIVEDTTDEEDEWGHPHNSNVDMDNGTGGEHEQLLRKSEEEAQHLAESLFADKWSLDRAILLYGTLDEQEAHCESTLSLNHQDNHDRMRDYEAEREELHRRLDVSQRKASQQLYNAYQQIQQAAHVLHLEPCVTRDAVHMLCRYAALKNGIHVKGVSTRMMMPQSNNGKKDSMKQDSVEQHRDLNRARQAGALGSALLYFSTRKLGHGRSLQQVCSSFSSNGDNDCHAPNHTKDESSFIMIQPKHCSRAMKEVKIAFPDYVRSSVVATTTPEPRSKIAATGVTADIIPSSSYRLKQEDDGVVVGMDVEGVMTASRNFVQHAVRSLALPEPAMHAIAVLFTQCTNDQRNLGWASGTKRSTLCGALTLLVCSAGATMQRLSQQAILQTTNHSKGNSHRPNKRIKIKHPTITTTATHEKKERKNEDEEPFDVMSHVSFDQKGTTTTAKRVREEEMKQMWNAWAKQSKSWARDARGIEQSCGITSRTVLLEHYKTYIHPRRANLLELLQQQEQCSLPSDDHSKNDASRWCLLFLHIATAAPLLTLNGSSSHYK